jgi:hypothetical protein
MSNYSFSAFLDGIFEHKDMADKVTEIQNAINEVINGQVALTVGNLGITAVVPTTDTSKPFNITSNPVSQSAASRQGAIFINVDRVAAYPFITWDGNPDCGLKIQAVNRAVSGTNGAVRGLDINARNRDSGTLSWLNGGTISITNSANTIQTAVGLQIQTDNGGVIAESLYGLVVQDNSQGTSAITNLLRITTGTINPASGARLSAINFAAKDTAGFTNAFYFEDAAGLEGATVSGSPAVGTLKGKIAVRVAATTYYLPVYESIA